MHLERNTWQIKCTQHLILPWLCHSTRTKKHRYNNMKWKIPWQRTIQRCAGSITKSSHSYYFRQKEVEIVCFILSWDPWRSIWQIQVTQLGAHHFHVLTFTINGKYLNMLHIILIRKATTASSSLCSIQCLNMV